MPKGYKITNFVRESAVMENDATVKYHINIVTEPNHGCGPLCVFATIDDALMFSNRHFTGKKRDRLFEVDYEPSTEKNLYCPHFTTKESAFPVGTILAKSVTLRREIVGDELADVFAEKFGHYDEWTKNLRVAAKHPELMGMEKEDDDEA